ncbi:MAG TPA: two-component regulator propeller domain-containing protein, partial [Ferruginibacter sp.]|nr:two-component regulator propeller domain-containing protein [Ferruginibacter sp.]
PVAAQQPIFKNYTVNDGLVSNSIRRVFQDSKGFLWIATWEGLSKYDGHIFTNYSTNNGLSHNLVNDFYESADGKLYIALNNGAIDIITDNTVVPNKGNSTIVVNSFINTPLHPVITPTDNNGLQEFRDGELLKPKQSFPNYTYHDISWINDSVFIASADSSITVFNKTYEAFAQIRENFSKFIGTKIYRDSKKRIWVGTSSGLKLMADIPLKNRPLVFSTLPSPFKIPELEQNKIIDILEDENGTLWFGTSGGLVKIYTDGSQQLITVKEGLASNIINCLFQDNEKNIWVGTAVGLSKFVSKSSIRFYGLENGVWSNDNVHLLYPFRKNLLLLSTQNGPEVFNKISGSFTPIGRSDNDFFYAAVTNSHPPLLIGLNNMARFDTLSFLFNNIRPLPMKPVTRIVSDKMGNFFLSNLEHLYFSSAKGQQNILDYRISSLIIDSKGDLWAGTWQNGLFRIRYTFTNNQFNIKSILHFLPKENIRCLYEDTKGSLWVGTRYKGVYRLSKDENENYAVSKFDQSKGLTSNFIKGIGEDANGNYWIAFYQGLDKIIPKENSFRIFNFSRINNYFASIIGMQTDEDRSLWLATGEGLTHIEDGELEKMPPLPVYITKVFSADSVYPLTANNVQLTHMQKQVQFEFSSPGFINEKQIMYSYRLVENAAAAWSAPANQHIVSYASLQPGSYHFEVRTLGWNGEWGKPATYDFMISPPFWQTWWFRSLLIILIAFFVYGLLKRRIKTIRHEAEMKQKIAETEMMALRAQMNPHFIFNCLNSIDNLIQMDEKEKATL